jgi:hypothetical protein
MGQQEMPIGGTNKGTQTQAGRIIIVECPKTNRKQWWLKKMISYYEFIVLGAGSSCWYW